MRLKEMKRIRWIRKNLSLHLLIQTILLEVLLKIQRVEKIKESQIRAREIRGLKDTKMKMEASR